MMKPEYKYRVVYRSNYDGDTIRFDFDLGLGTWNKGEAGKGVAIRLKGIDTPEMRGEELEEGRKAQEFVADILSCAQDIVVETFKDATGKYGRYIAVVWFLPQDTSTWVMLNELLESKGLAERKEY